MFKSFKIILIFSMLSLAKTSNKTHVLDLKTTGLFLTIDVNVKPFKVSHRTSKRNIIVKNNFNREEIPEKVTDETNSQKLIFETKDVSFMERLFNYKIFNDTFVKDIEYDENKYEIKETNSIKPPRHSIIKNGTEICNNIGDAGKYAEMYDNPDGITTNIEHLNEVSKEHSQKDKNVNLDTAIIELFPYFPSHDEKIKTADALISRSKPENSEVIANLVTKTNSVNDNNNIDAKLTESKTNMILSETEDKKIVSEYSKSLSDCITGTTTNVEHLSEISKENSEKYHKNTKFDGALLEILPNFTITNINFKTDDALVKRSKANNSEVADISLTAYYVNNKNISSEVIANSVTATNSVHVNDNLDSKPTKSKADLISEPETRNVNEMKIKHSQSLHKKRQVPIVEGDEYDYDENVDYTLTKPPHISDKELKINDTQLKETNLKNELLLEMLPQYVKPIPKEVTITYDFGVTEVTEHSINVKNSNNLSIVNPFKVENVDLTKSKSTSTPKYFEESSIFSFKKKQNTSDTKPIRNKTVTSMHNMKAIISTEQNYKFADSIFLKPMRIEITTQRNNLVTIKSKLPFKNTSAHNSKEKYVTTAVSKDKVLIKTPKDLTNLNVDFQDVSISDIKSIDKKEATEISANTSVQEADHEKCNNINNLGNIRDDSKPEYEVIPLFTSKAFGHLNKEIVHANVSLNKENYNNNKEKVINVANNFKDEQWHVVEQINLTNALNFTNEDISGTIFGPTFPENKLEKHNIHSMSIQKPVNSSNLKKLDCVNVGDNATESKKKQCIDGQRNITDFKALKIRNCVLNDIFNRTTVINGTLLGNSSLKNKLVNKTKSFNVDTTLKEVDRGNMSDYNHSDELKNFTDRVLKMNIIKYVPFNETSIDNNQNHTSKGSVTNDTNKKVLETTLNKYLHKNKTKDIDAFVFNNKNFSQENHTAFINTTMKNKNNISFEVKQKNQLNEKDIKRLLIITTPSCSDQNTKTVKNIVKNENNNHLNIKEIMKKVNTTRKSENLLIITTPKINATTKSLPRIDHGQSGITKGGILIRNINITKTENEKQYTRSAERKIYSVDNIFNQNTAKLNLSESMAQSAMPNVLKTRRTINSSIPKLNINSSTTVNNTFAKKDHNKDRSNEILNKFSIKLNGIPYKKKNKHVRKFSPNVEVTYEILNKTCKGNDDKTGETKQVIDESYISTTTAAIATVSNKLSTMTISTKVPNNKRSCCKNKSNNTMKHKCCHDKHNMSDVVGRNKQDAQTINDSVIGNKTSETSRKNINLLDIVIRNPFQVTTTPHSNLRNKETPSKKYSQESIKSFRIHPCVMKGTLKKSQKENKKQRKKPNNTHVYEYVKDKVINETKNNDQVINDTERNVKKNEVKLYASKPNFSVLRDNNILSNETSIILKALYNVTHLLQSIYDKLPAVIEKRCFKTLFLETQDQNTDVTDLLVSISDKLPKDDGNKTSKTYFALETHDKTPKYLENSTSQNISRNITTVTSKPFIYSSNASRQGQTTKIKDSSKTETDDFTIYKDSNILRFLQNLSDALDSVHKTLRKNDSTKLENGISRPNITAKTITVGVETNSEKNGLSATFTEIQNGTSVVNVKIKDFKKIHKDIKSKSNKINIANKSDESINKLLTAVTKQGKLSDNDERKDNISKSNQAETKDTDNFNKETVLNFDTIWSEQQVNHDNRVINVKSFNKIPDEARKLVENAEMVRKIINNDYVTNDQDSINYETTFSNITGLEIVEDSTKPQDYIENISTPTTFDSKQKYLESVVLPSNNKLEDNLGHILNASKPWHDIILSKPTASLRLLNNFILNNKTKNRHSKIQPYSLSTTKTPVACQNYENMVQKLLENASGKPEKSLIKIDDKIDDKDRENIHKILHEKPTELPIRPRTDMIQKDLPSYSFDNNEHDYGTKILECLLKGLPSLSNEKDDSRGQTKEVTEKSFKSTTTNTISNNKLTTTTAATMAPYEELFNDIIGDLRHRPDLLEKLSQLNKETNSLTTDQKSEEKTVSSKPVVLKTVHIPIETTKHISKSKLLFADRVKDTSTGLKNSMRSTFFERLDNPSENYNIEDPSNYLDVDSFKDWQKRRNIGDYYTDKSMSLMSIKEESFEAAKTRTNRTIDENFKPDNIIVSKEKTAEFVRSRNKIQQITESVVLNTVNTVVPTKKPEPKLLATQILQDRSTGPKNNYRSTVLEKPHMPSKNYNIDKPGNYLDVETLKDWQKRGNNDVYSSDKIIIQKTAACGDPQSEKKQAVQTANLKNDEISQNNPPNSASPNDGTSKESIFPPDTKPRKYILTKTHNKIKKSRMLNFNINRDFEKHVSLENTDAYENQK